MANIEKVQVTLNIYMKLVEQIHPEHEHLMDIIHFHS